MYCRLSSLNSIGGRRLIMHKLLVSRNLATAARIKGSIKTFNKRNGLISTENGEDFSVHKSALKSGYHEPQPGDIVEFQPADKGSRVAWEVAVIKRKNPLQSIRTASRENKPSVSERGNQQSFDSGVYRSSQAKNSPGVNARGSFNYGEVNRARMTHDASNNRLEHNKGWELGYGGAYQGGNLEVNRGNSSDFGDQNANQSRYPTQVVPTPRVNRVYGNDDRSQKSNQGEFPSAVVRNVNRSYANDGGYQKGIPAKVQVPANQEKKKNQFVSYTEDDWEDNW